MINKWNFQTPSEEELHKRDQLVAELGFSPVICLLLVQRGITSIEEAKKFFKPSLNDLHDPFLMPDMEKAVKRLNKALGNKEKILIYGDYDVDGTTAVSLVYKYLRPYSSALDYYIPDRYDEGYGISYKGINYARENGITLVISLDCGIKPSKRSNMPSSWGSILLSATITCRTTHCPMPSPYWMPSGWTRSIRTNICRDAASGSSSCRHSPKATTSRLPTWRNCWS